MLDYDTKEVPAPVTRELVARVSVDRVEGFFFYVKPNAAEGVVEVYRLAPNRKGALEGHRTTYGAKGRKAKRVYEAKLRGEKVRLANTKVTDHVEGKR